MNILTNSKSLDFYRRKDNIEEETLEGKLNSKLANLLANLPFLWRVEKHGRRTKVS